MSKKRKRQQPNAVLGMRKPRGSHIEGCWGDREEGETSTRAPKHRGALPGPVPGRGFLLPSWVTKHRASPRGQTQTSSHGFALCKKKNKIIKEEETPPPAPPSEKERMGWWGAEGRGPLCSPTSLGVRFGGHPMP